MESESNSHGIRLAMIAVALLASVLLALTLMAGTADAGNGEAVREAKLADLVSKNEKVADAMRDGRIETDEVRGALNAAVGCLQDKGIVVTAANFEDNGTLSLTYVGGASAREADMADEYQRVCFTQHFDDMADAFGLVNHPSDEEMERFRQANLECLREVGVMTSDDASIAAVSDRNAVMTCAAQSEALVFGR